MIRFNLIMISFALMFLAFYELSGGSNFEPSQRQSVAQSAPPADVVTEALPTQAIDEPTFAQTDRSQNTATLQRVALTISEPVGGDTEGASVADAIQTEVVLPGLAELIGGADLSKTIVVTQTSQESAPADIRKISASRVNMRAGPGTSFGIVAKLNLGNQMEVLADEGDGWVRVRPADGGQVGWVADFLLTNLDG